MKKKEGKRACWHMSQKPVNVEDLVFSIFYFLFLFSEGFAREIDCKEGVCVQSACVPILAGLAHCTMHHGQKHNHKHKRKHKHKHEHGHKMRGRPDTLFAHFFGCA